MRIYLASDHAGVALKHTILNWLQQQNNADEVTDLGPYDDASVDYPDYAEKTAEEMRQNPESKAILICGSGVGISIAANRHEHVRAALVHNAEIATLARQHNDANVLCLGARFMTDAIAKDCVHAFLNTAFEGGRHQRRVDKLSS